MKVDTIMAAETKSESLDKLKEVIREVMREFTGSDEKAAQVRERDEITYPEQRILDTVNWLEHCTGKKAFKPDIVAYFARHQVEQPAFKNARNSLRRKGLIEHTYAGWMQLTAAGRPLSKTVMYVNRKIETKLKDVPVMVD